MRSKQSFQQSQHLHHLAMLACLGTYCKYQGKQYGGGYVSAHYDDYAPQLGLVFFLSALQKKKCFEVTPKGGGVTI